VTFSAPVTGVDAGDFALTHTGISGPSIDAVTGSGATYTVTVNSGLGSGTLRLDVVDDDTILDGSGNPLGSAGTGNGNFTSGQTYSVAGISTSTPTPTETPTPGPTPTLLPPGDGTGLAGAYFDNSMDIDGAPVYTRLDPQVNFNWGDLDPHGEDSALNDFTTRWTGQIEPRSSEEYIFSVFADDLARVSIDGRPYLDAWTSQPGDWVSGPPISLTAGQKYDIQIDFRDTGGGASIEFRWQTLSGSLEWEIVPMQQLYLPAGGLPPTATPAP
jgi:hypothetical protein